ncbi:MAG: hypothetical protein J6M31_01495 [Bacteroidales bacterium]|nr:hypothetical protein [Bacteroidales bacterium]
MNKKSFLLFLALCSVSVLAQAQAFRHWAVGAGVGSDGISLEVTTPLTGILELRAGYSLGTGLAGYTYKGLSVPEHPAMSGSESVTVPARISTGMNEGKLLLNLYPGKHSFHFVLGAYLGSSRLLRLTLQDMPDDYNTAGLNIDGYLVRAHEGRIKAGLHAGGLGGHGFAVKPYLGIGFGRAFPRGKRLGYTIDLGLQYMGALGVWAPGEGLTGRVRDVQLTSAHLGAMAKFEKIAQYVQVWPVLNFHLHYSIF